MEAIKRPAPAKINLALDILGLRPDGYHEMRMVMQTVSLCDTVTLAEGEKGFSLDTDGDFLPAGGKTLEQRAVEAHRGLGADWTDSGQRHALLRPWGYRSGGGPGGGPFGPAAAAAMLDIVM